MRSAEQRLWEWWDLAPEPGAGLPVFPSIPSCHWAPCSSAVICHLSEVRINTRRRRWHILQCPETNCKSSACHFLSSRKLPWISFPCTLGASSWDFTQSEERCSFSCTGGSHYLKILRDGFQFMLAEVLSAFIMSLFSFFHLFPHTPGLWQIINLPSSACICRAPGEHLIAPACYRTSLMHHLPHTQLRNSHIFV